MRAGGGWAPRAPPSQPHPNQICAPHGAVAHRTTAIGREAGKPGLRRASAGSGRIRSEGDCTAEDGGAFAHLKHGAHAGNQHHPPPVGGGQLAQALAGGGAHGGGCDVNRACARDR